MRANYNLGSMWTSIWRSQRRIELIEAVHRNGGYDLMKRGGDEIWRAVLVLSNGRSQVEEQLMEEV